MTIGSISTKAAAEHCRRAADDERRLSAQHSGTEKRRDEHAAKAHIADRLAREFDDMMPSDAAVRAAVDLSARRLAPQAFALFDQTVDRLIGQGMERTRAEAIAEAGIGAALADARRTAAQRAVGPGAVPEAMFIDGVEAASKWHETQAAEAKRLAGLETDRARASAYSKRAERHLLYARRLREDVTPRSAPNRKPVDVIKEGRSLAATDHDSVRGDGVPIETQIETQIEMQLSARARTARSDDR